MALRHVRAVQERTRLDDPIARSIIQVIATDIGHDDSPAYPSYRTIAVRAGCHYNTVADRIKALCDNGDLVVTKRGKYNYYSLPYACDNAEGDYHASGGDNLAAPAARYVTREELSQLEQRLSHQMEQIVTSLSHQIGQIITPLSHQPSHIVTPSSQGLSHIVTSQDVTEENERGKEREEEKKEGREEAPPPPATAISPEKQRLAEMVNALSDATGMSGHLNWDKLSPFATELIRLDYTPEQVVRHYGPTSENGCWNWRQHDWRGVKGEFPTLEHIRQTISGAVVWQPPAVSANGSGSHAGNGHPTPTDPLAARRAQLLQEVAT